MATLRERRKNFLVKSGFLPQEASELARTSRAGLKAPYFQRMIASRRRLYQNAIRYKWSDTRYRNYIRDKYLSASFIKKDALGRKRIDVWAMLRDWQDKSKRVGEEYESPWVNTITRKSRQRQTQQRITKKQALQSWIRRLNRDLERTTNENKRQQILTKIGKLESQLQRDYS